MIWLMLSCLIFYSGPITLSMSTPCCAYFHYRNPYFIAKIIRGGIRFYRVGGTTRLSGLLLAIFTTGLLIAGTGPIAYIRKIPRSKCQ